MGLSGNMLRLWMIGGVFVTPFTLGAQRVVRDFRSPQVVDIAVVSEEVTFSKQRVTEQAKVVLEQQRPRPTLFRFMVGTQIGEVSRALWHGKPEGDLYDETLDDLKTYGPLRGWLARVISLPRGALLSYRDKGRYFEDVLQGTGDPAEFSVGGTKYKLVHFHLTEVRAVKRRFWLDLYFVRPTPLSLSNCATLLRQVQSLTQIQDITVNVRTRPWFPDDSTFPAQYPFQADLSIPSVGEYLTMPHMTCSTASGQLSAGGNNIVP